MAVAVLAGACGPGSPAPRTTDVEAGGDGGDSAEACPWDAPRTADGYADLIASQPGGWLTGDGAASVTLPDGRELWMFGDSVVRSPGGALLLRSSTALLQDGGCLALATPERELLPAAGGYDVWPTAAVAVSDHLVVFGQLVARWGGGAPEFALRGTVAYEVRVVRDRAEAVRSVRLPSTDAGSDESPQWGAAVAVRAGTAYVYGTARSPDPAVFGRDAYVARVPLSLVTEIGRWRYWDGTAWSARPTSAVAVSAGVGGVSTAFSAIVSGDGSTTWVSKADDFLGAAVTVWTADSPVGPFGARAVLDAPSTDTVLRFLPMAHPGLELDSGRLLVSVSRTTAEPGALLADPARFLPEFAEVRLRP